MTYFNLPTLYITRTLVSTWHGIHTATTCPLLQPILSAGYHTTIMSPPTSLIKPKCEKVHLCPISSYYPEYLQHALLDPSYTPHTMLSHVLNKLNPVHQEALNHLKHIENTSAKLPNRLITSVENQSDLQLILLMTLLISSKNAITLLSKSAPPKQKQNMTHI